MDKIIIQGGVPLKGEITISGAKNAALPLMAATLLTDAPLTLKNVPNLVDIRTLASLLEQHGTNIVRNISGQELILTTSSITSTTAPYELVRKMRASVLVLGALLARCGEAIVSLPGGCAIGTRPVDLHLKGLETMGAVIELENGYINARAPNGLQGAVIHFPYVSVGATENLLMAATLANGETTLTNAAKEPEVVDLAQCLKAMGANIEGIGTDRLVIQGVKSLQGATYSVLPDRIEAGTYMIAAAITGGDVLLKNCNSKQLETFIDALRKANVQVEEGDNSIRVACDLNLLKGVDVMTEPYPSFPTDLQAQLMALMTLASGASMITETIFENRFMHVPELCRMGANVTIHKSSALVRGTRQLIGAPVMATDLRASSSLVLAGLAAKGETTIHRVYHLDRGYEQLEQKLSNCGAIIRRAKEDEELAA